MKSIIFFFSSYSYFLPATVALLWFNIQRKNLRVSKIKWLKKSSLINFLQIYGYILCYEFGVILYSSVNLCKNLPKKSFLGLTVPYFCFINRLVVSSLSFVIVSKLCNTEFQNFKIAFV